VPKSRRWCSPSFFRLSRLCGCPRFHFTISY
jgi:hypothetical protein